MQFLSGLQAARDFCSLDLFPLPHSLAGYNSSMVPGDLRAGPRVALLAFPQGIWPTPDRRPTHPIRDLWVRHGRDDRPDLRALAITLGPT